MSSVHFYTAILGFALGIFWQSFFNVGLAECLCLVMVAGAFYLIGARKSSANYYYLKLGIIFLVFVVLGLGRFAISDGSAVNPEYENLVGQDVNLVGVIVREPEVREKLTQLYVRVEEELLLVSTDRYQEFTYGQQIEFNGELQKPESFATDLGRTFDYPNYLLARGVAYQVPFAKVTNVDSHKGNWFLERLFTAKQKFLNKLETIIVEPEVGLAEGLLLGVKRAIGEDLEIVFRETGIIHIVVLSGYNIMIVVTFVMYLLGRLLSKKWQVVFGIVSIVLFAILVGLSATVVRASIMASLLLIMGLTGRTYIALRGLFLAGFFMLLINPYLLAFDVGFQLSFLATLGLILGSPLLLSRLSFVPNFVGAREFLVATLTTQLFVLPLLLYSMGQISLVAIIVNVLVLPAVPAAMLLTFITGMVGFVSTTIALPFAFLAHLSLTYIIITASWFSKLPFASVEVPVFPFWIVPILYGIIFYIVYRFNLKTPISKSTTVINLAGWTIEEEIEVIK